jgi:hypothetical protein
VRQHLPAQPDRPFVRNPRHGGIKGAVRPLGYRNLPTMG